MRTLGSRPVRRLSQSFLSSHAIAEAMVRAADVGSDDLVLEIGPGLGVLTGPLVRSARSVVAVEVDPALAEALPATLDTPPNLHVVRGDALTVDLARLVAEPYLVVASLPYHVATPILFKLLFTPPRPKRAVVMLQEEVAVRMAPQGGSLTYLGAAVATVARARIVRRVPPRAFFPVPKVRSAVVRLDLLDHPSVAVASIEGFLSFLRAGFAQPRKQLHNSLAQGLGIPAASAAEAARRAGIDPARRPGDLSPEEWAALYRRLGTAVGE